MPPDPLSPTLDLPPPPIETPARSRHSARSRRQIRRAAVDRAAPADVRDACGLKWKFSQSSWPSTVRLILWATRNNRG